MSDDSFLFSRPYNGGILVTREGMSQDVPSPAAEAYERAMGPNSLGTDGFFDDETQADNFIEAKYDEWDDACRPFEYGPSWSDNPDNFTSSTD